MQYRGGGEAYTCRKQNFHFCVADPDLPDARIWILREVPLGADPDEKKNMETKKISTTKIFTDVTEIFD